MRLVEDAAQVLGADEAARDRQALQDGGRDALPGQAVGERAGGQAAADDQDARGAHVSGGFGSGAVRARAGSRARTLRAA